MPGSGCFSAATSSSVNPTGWAHLAQVEMSSEAGAAQSAGNSAQTPFCGSGPPLPGAISGADEDRVEFKSGGGGDEDEQHDRHAGLQKRPPSRRDSPGANA